MPATIPTVLANIMDAIAENLATITVIGAGTDQLFGGDGTPANWDVPEGPARATRVYFQGEPIPVGGPFPLVVMRFEDEEFDQLNQTTKLGQIMPWILEVAFDMDPNTEPDAHPTLRDIHTNLIAAIKDHFILEANRRLPTAANPTGTPGVEDTTYEGGGAELIPLDEDAESPGGSARYAFVLQFSTTYRHVPGDSRTAA